MIHFRGRMKEEMIDFFAETFLFSKIPKKKLSAVIDSICIHIESYPTKTYVFKPGCTDNRLCFIKNGKCIVERLKNDGTTVPLNKMTKYDSFGILSVLSEEEPFPTAIITSGECEIVSISQDDVLKLIYSDPQIAMNVISFLARKVSFLNNKVATFSSDSVEEKLSNFLLFEMKRLNTREFDFNAKKTAEAISAGRASLYRAITSLTNEGLISLSNKKINIIDPQGLERNTK